MQIKRYAIAVLFLLTFFITEKGHGIVTVHYPTDKTVMELALLSVSIGVPQGSTDSIEVRVNGKREAAIVPDLDVECFSLPLVIGMNTINIIVKKQGALIEELTFEVFRRSELVSVYTNPPKGFQKNYFHMKEHAKCAGCHTLVPTDLDRKPINIATFRDKLADYKTVATSASTCYSCHKKITSYPFVHGPSSVWSCLNCHDETSGLKYSVKKPVSEACFSCHSEERDERNKKKYFHGPYNVGKCTICHNPHASENPYYLVKPTWLLCLSCHEDKGSGEHVVKGYLDRKSHPTHGKPDPLREGRELTCASCHNPHASDSPKLWRLKVETGFALCMECHMKINK